MLSIVRELRSELPFFLEKMKIKASCKLVCNSYNKRK